MADINIYVPTDAASAPSGYEKRKSSAKTLADSSQVQRVVPAVSTGADTVADVSAAAPLPVALRLSDGTAFAPATADGLTALATILGAVGASPAANTVGARLKAIADLLTTQAAYLDGVETNQTSGNTLLTAIDGKLGAQAAYLDGLETGQATGNTALDLLANILGSVSATPTANTVQARLKGIADLLTTHSGYLDGVETNQASGNALLTAIDTKLGTQAGYLDGVEGSLASILAKLIAAPATEAKQDALFAETARVGTRAYGTGTRLAFNGTSAVSAAITATEVMLHATARCFVKAGATPTAVDTGDSIPLEAGEKFTMRITSGHKIAAVRSATDTDGALFITPVA